jgi:Uma2 family endonuclease
MAIVSQDEYLKFERASEEKHEYYAGKIFDFPHANQYHNLITGCTAASLHFKLSTGPCEVYISRMRMKIRSTGLYTYSDICVVCSEPEFEDSEFDTLLNPTVIIEVYSPLTEAYDRGKKFQHYRQLESLEEYVLIAQDEICVEKYIRRKNEWIFSDANTLDAVINLTSIDCSLHLSDVYEKITFDKPEGLH